MRRLQFLTIVFLLALPVSAAAQENAASSDAAIRQLIQYYFEGWRNYDAASIRKAYHREARLFYKPTNATSLEDTTGRRLSDHFEHYGRRKTAEVVLQRILSIDVTGDAASVKVEIEYPDSWLSGGKVSLLKPAPGLVETRYLSLIKFDDGWRIVSDVYTVRERESK